MKSRLEPNTVVMTYRQEMGIPMVCVICWAFPVCKAGVHKASRNIYYRKI